MKNAKALTIALATIFSLSMAGNSEALNLKKSFNGAKKGISKTLKKTKKVVSKKAKGVHKQAKKTSKVAYIQTKKTSQNLRRTVKKVAQPLNHGIHKAGKAMDPIARKAGKTLKKGAIATQKWGVQAYKDVKKTANQVCRDSNQALESTYSGAKRGAKKHVGDGWARNSAEFATDVTFDYGADAALGGACATQRIVLNPVKSFHKTKRSAHQLGKGISRFSKDPVRHTGHWGKGAIHTIARAPKNIASGNYSSEREQVSAVRNMTDPLSYMDPGE